MLMYKSRFNIHIFFQRERYFIYVSLSKCGAPTWDTESSQAATSGTHNSLLRNRRKRNLVTSEISAKFLRASRSFAVGTFPFLHPRSRSHSSFVSVGRTCNGAPICYGTWHASCNTLHMLLF